MIWAISLIGILCRFYDILANCFFERLDLVYLERLDLEKFGYFANFFQFGGCAGDSDLDPDKAENVVGHELRVIVVPPPVSSLVVSDCFPTF